MRPVFIVGMPRSGSTLLEQILSRHPDVCCAGETTTFGEKLAMVRRDAADLPLFPAFMRTIDAEALERVSSAYRMHMHERGAPAGIFVNKLLINFLFMGAIHMAMPDARFIVAKRNALDTCFSAFTNYFGFHVPYSYDLGELGRFYRKYEQVIAHWEQVLPEGVMRTINYEAVVSDIETQARGLLDFLGLALGSGVSHLPSVEPAGTDRERRAGAPPPLPEIDRALAPVRAPLAAACGRAQRRSVNANSETPPAAVCL